jgi:hypothetical protein
MLLSFQFSHQNPYILPMRTSFPDQHIHVDILISMSSITACACYNYQRETGRAAFVRNAHWASRCQRLHERGRPLRALAIRRTTGAHVRIAMTSLGLDLSATYICEEFLNVLRRPATNLPQGRLLAKLRRVLRHAPRARSTATRLTRTKTAAGRSCWLSLRR